MRSFWRGIVGVIFWSYERGSWPYDVLVIAIVIFVLATPRGWFHDRPRSGAAANSSVELISEDAGTQTHTYRLAANALSPEKRTTKATPELERETHNILARTVDDLNDRTFQVLRINPVTTGDGLVLYYEVTVSP